MRGLKLLGRYGEKLKIVGETIYSYITIRPVEKIYMESDRPNKPIGQEVINADYNYKYKEGFYSELMNDAYDLFASTREGKFIINLFTTDFKNKHSIRFVERNESWGDTHGSNTAHYRLLAEPGLMLFPKSMEERLSNIDNIIRKWDEKMFNENGYKIGFVIYSTFFPRTYSDPNIDHEKVALAYTIGHEIFIHAIRKWIPAIQLWETNNFTDFLNEVSRDVGYKGAYDHEDYLKNKTSRGLHMMYEFGESLRKEVGNKIYYKVKKEHDTSLYEHTKKYFRK